MKTKPVFLIITFLQLIIAFNAGAQKLPNIQMIGVRAPVNTKADGKATEWNNQFQAHNASADVLYSIANDDENLYLVVQAKDVNVINTIVGYGFEFEIQKWGKKDDKDKISVTYPVVPKGAPVRFGGKNGLLTDTSAGAANIIMNSNNNVFDQKFKTIIVTGIKGLDTLSIYNESGIKAVGRFDSKMVYTLEIAVALKHIGLFADGTSKFAYHMIFNGYTPQDFSAGKVSMLMNDGTVQQVDGNTPEMQQAMTELNMKIARRNPHTDFWGEYTLVKK